MIVSLLGALLFCLAAFVPEAWLRHLGSWIRRSDDVTLERVLRYRQVCAAFSAGCAVLAAWCHFSAAGIAGFLGDVQVELASAKPFDFFSRTNLRSARSFAALLLAGTALRLMYLPGPMDYDEAYTFLNYARRPWYEAIADYNSTNNHPLNTFLMHWAYRIGGQRDWVLRMPVFCAGVLVMPLAAIWASARLGRRAGLLCLAFVACSPTMIDYSVNARGYMFVTAAALLLDICLDAIDAGSARSHLAWCGAWLALVFGLWAMPIMIYPLAGSAGWFLLAPCLADRTAFRQRFGSLLRLGGLGCLAVAGLYAPAYIFRGLVAFENPFVLPLTFPAWLAETPLAWANALRRWCAGAAPLYAWGIMLAAGMAVLIRQRQTAFRIGTLFAATFVLFAAQRVAPPPRVWVFLAPWVYVVAAFGLERMIGVLSQQDRWFERAAAVIVAGGIAYAALRYPVIGEPAERDRLVSVRDAIERICQDTGTTGRNEGLLLAPLPCDLPALYYLAQAGSSMPINRPPRPGETIWLIGAPGQSPDATLADQVVGLSQWKHRLAPWHKVADFASLSLWRSGR